MPQDVWGVLRATQKVWVIERPKGSGSEF